MPFTARELQQEASELRSAARDQEMFGRAQIKREDSLSRAPKIKKHGTEYTQTAKRSGFPFGQERIDIAKKFRAKADSLDNVANNMTIKKKKKN